MKPETELIEQRHIYSTPYWDIYDDRVRRRNGEEGNYIWATTNDGACLVLVKTPQSKFALIKVFRYTVQEYLWECVAGQSEPNEPPEECAKREVLEEIGVKVKKLVPLGTFIPISGFTRDRFHAFVAEVAELNEEQFKLQGAEGIVDIKLVDDGELRRMVANGEIEDGGTLTALGLYWSQAQT